MKHRPGNTVSNLSSTRALRDVTEKAGCNYSPAAVGEVNVVTKMKEVHAVVGGEGNGGIIVPDFHFGRDALIGIGLFLSHLARSKKKVSKLRKDYPEYFISKNKIELTPTINVDKVLQGVQEKYKSEKINLTDGVRIDFEKEREWVHLRKSNTEAIVRIIAESKTEKRATELANQLIKDMQKIVKG
jgi:phosphomannomutase